MGTFLVITSFIVIVLFSTENELGLPFKLFTWLQMDC